VRTLQGEDIQGTLVAVTADEVVLAVQGTRRSWPAAELATVSLPTHLAATVPPVAITLTDESVLRGIAFTSQGAQGTLQFPNANPLELPLAQLKSVRLQDSLPKESEAWLSLARESANADRLVIRRQGAGGSISLDTLEGVTGEIGETHVAFTSDGDRLQVKRDRVEGVLFRRPPPSHPRTKLIFTDRHQSQFAVSALSMERDQLHVQTPSGLKVVRSLHDVWRFDFGAANCRYWSTELLDQKSHSSWLDTLGSTTMKSVGPLFDRAPSGPLTMTGKVWPRGVWLPARSALTLRVPLGFTRLSVQAGYDDRVPQTDGARLIVAAEGKVLYDELVPRHDTPTSIQLPLGDARRVRVSVDYGGESRLGDTLILSEAMFTP
jgi:hypothetical protein